MQTTTKEKVNLEEAMIPPKKGRRKQNNNIVKINSRFGEIEVDKTKRISFKHGILGIPTAVSFCLTELPDVSNNQFKLLQCLEDDELSFIVVPSQYDNQLIEKEDLDEACKVIDINTDHLLILFIVTIHDNENKRYISVNAKAPVLVDAISKTATQYVLQSPNYDIQHRIS